MTLKSHNLKEMNKRTALFAGSFNPFTIGHLDILTRGLEIFDLIYVVRGVNISKSGSRTDVDDLKYLEDHFKRIKVMSWDGLTVDCAEQLGAKFLLRGARSASEFEKERDLAEINFKIGRLETVILPSRPELSSISSSMVRELEAFGKDASEFYALNKIENEN